MGHSSEIVKRGGRPHRRYCVSDDKSDRLLSYRAPCAREETISGASQICGDLEQFTRCIEVFSALSVASERLPPGRVGLERADRLFFRRSANGAPAT